MEMSYKHAWDLIDSMNRQGRAPLVITSKGGKGGGGARLSNEGEKAIRLFWETYERFNRFLAEESNNVKV